MLFLQLIRLNVRTRLFFIFLFLAVFSYGQKHIYTQYTTANGLPSSEVYDIIQDDYGYLWFGTDHGICRYDGYTFEQYDTKDGLTNNTVFKFTKDTQGTIWCCCYGNSIFSIKGEDPKFTPYKYNHLIKKTPFGAIISQLYIDKKGTFFITYLNTLGFSCVENDGILSSSLREIDTTEGELITKFALFPSGKCLAFSSQDTPQADTNFASISEITFISSQIPSRYKTYAIFNKSDSSIVSMNQTNLTVINPHGSLKHIEQPMHGTDIGTWSNNQFWSSSFSDGVRIYDENYKLLKHFLPGLSVTKIFRDHENGIWISTLHDGVFHIINENITSYNICEHKLEQAISQIFAQEDSSIWIGLINGDLYNIKNNKSTLHYSSKNTWPLSFGYDKLNNKLYFSSNNQIISVLEKDTLIDFAKLNFKVNLKQYPNTFILYGNKGVSFASHLKENDIEEYHNVLYTASNEGLHILTSDSIQNISKFSNYKNASRIDDLEKFRDFLVLGTKGDGIHLFNGDKIIKITKQDGLTSDFITKVYAEDNQTLWACTNNGLNRLNFAEDKLESVYTYNYASGLISNEITDVTVLNGVVWIGTRKGLCSFQKGQFRQLAQHKINYGLTLKTVSINDLKTEFIHNLDLDYTANRAEFTFIAKSFLENENLEYRYKLDGLEPNWIYTKQTNVTYPSLNPGEYTFRVQVKGLNKDWGEEIKLHLSISPPFWITWWFILSIILCLILIIYLFFKYRVLVYNRGILIELIRQIVKRLRKGKPYIIIKHANTDVKIETSNITYVKSDGNYLEIHTPQKKYVTREKIGNFLNIVPDPIEFIQVKRSFIVRIDAVTGKGKRHLIVNDQKIEIGNTYIDALEKISL